MVPFIVLVLGLGVGTHGGLGSQGVGSSKKGLKVQGIFSKCTGFRIKMFRIKPFTRCLRHRIVCPNLWRGLPTLAAYVDYKETYHGI